MQVTSFDNNPRPAVLVAQQPETPASLDARRKTLMNTMRQFAASIVVTTCLSLIGACASQSPGRDSAGISTEAATMLRKELGDLHAQVDALTLSLRDTTNE